MTELLEINTEGWWEPDQLSDDENNAISAALEAFFGQVKEEKREFPHELSELLKSFFGSQRLCFALNAGDGSILTAFEPAYTFGIEPEEKRSRKRQGRYQAIVGDFNRVGKLLEPLGTKIGDTICVIRDEAQKDDLMEFLNANQEDDAVLAFVLPINADIMLPGAFACVEGGDSKVVFCMPVTKLKDTGTAVPVRKATADTLDLLGPWIQQQKEDRCMRDYRYSDQRQAKTFKEIWTAVHREYGRRFIRPDATFDLALVGGKLLNYDPSAYAKMCIGANSSLGDLHQRIHNRDIAFFAQNSGLWRELMILEDEGYMLIEPRLIAAVLPIIEIGERITTPLRPLKPQERLGYLGETSKIKCKRDDEEKGLKKGKWYTIYLRQQSYEKFFSKTEPVKGVLQLVRKKRRYFHQQIVIDGRHSFYDDDGEDIKYLLKYFEVPEKRDVRTRYPELIEGEDKRIAAIQEKYLTPKGFKFKDYQAKDIAALSVNHRGICAWQQGLGKTLGGLAFAFNAAMKENPDRIDKTPVLVIAPQDLIPQWQAEAKKFYGIDLEWIGRHKGKNAGNGGVEVKDGNGGTNITGGAIQNLVDARSVAKRIREGHGGFYITHFEALTSGGAKNLRKIEEPYVVRRETVREYVEGHYSTDENGYRHWHEGEWQDVEKEITSAEECPECGNKLYGSYFCHALVNREHGGRRRCNWTRYTYRLPNIGKILATAFRRGVIVVDEGTQIASARNSNENDSSQKTKAVCGMRSKYRLVMSGTPIKNFVAQAFWLLWWGIGNMSERFPYSYAGGKAEFAKDYTVLEWTYNDQSGQWHKQTPVGEVTNHTKLWAQFASVLLRRVKEETGELIVKKATHVIHAPLGYYQREQMDFWLRNFPDLFAEKYPNDPKVKRGSHRQMAAILGLDHKLNYAAVLPSTDPDADWTQVPVSDYTPAAYKTLETIMALVAQGRRVLVGTDVKKASPWLAARLAEKGISARTMLKNNGSGDTLDPADRSKVVEEFQTGEMAVLCSTQKAIRLGHNLDKGSAVVLLGLDWDYETFAQFTERVHRLTSENPIDVYVIIPGEPNQTLIGRKWDRITDKAKGAGMAIDGHIPEQNEDPPDIAAIVREMVEKGIPATGKEVKESDVREAWEKVPQIESFEVPAEFVIEQAKPWVIDWEKANAALDEYLKVKAEYEADEAERKRLEMIALFGMFKEITSKQKEEAENEAFYMNDWIDALYENDVIDAYAEDARRSAGQVTDVTSSFTSPPASPTVEEVRESSDGIAIAVVPAEAQEPVLVTPEPEVVEEQQAAPPASIDPMAQLAQAAELHKLGILSDDEFAAVKREMLAALGVGA